MNKHKINEQKLERDFFTVSRKLAELRIIASSPLPDRKKLSNVPFKLRLHEQELDRELDKTTREVQGYPLPILEYPAEKSAWDDKLEQVNNEIDRLPTFSPVKTPGKLRDWFWPLIKNVKEKLLEHELNRTTAQIIKKEPIIIPESVGKDKVLWDKRLRKVEREMNDLQRSFSRPVNVLAKLPFHSKQDLSLLQKSDLAREKQKIDCLLAGQKVSPSKSVVELFRKKSKLLGQNTFYSADKLKKISKMEQEMKKLLNE